MNGLVLTAGERLLLTLGTRASGDLARSVLGAPAAVDADQPPPTVEVTVGRSAPGFPPGRALGRQAWVRGSSVLLAGAAGSDHVTRVEVDGDRLTVVAAHAPSVRDRVLGAAAPSRARLLRAAALFHYPVLWRAGLRGRVPLHASALRVDGLDVLVAGLSGSGKSTLVAAEEHAGALVGSDNLVVADATSVHGLREPRRTAQRTPGARRTTHGRWETPASYAPALELRPDVVVVLRRTGAPVSLGELSPEAATRELVASTYAAGELRRYWPWAATLAAGTGCGPAHPAVEAVARQVCEQARCFVLEVGRTPGPHLSTSLRAMGALRCA